MVRNPWLKQTTTPRKKGERGESQAIPLPPLVAGGSLSDGRSNGFSVAWRKEEGRRGFSFPLGWSRKRIIGEEGRKRTVATATAIRRLRERSNRSKTWKSWRHLSGSQVGCRPHLSRRGRSIGKFYFLKTPPPPTHKENLSLFLLPLPPLSSFFSPVKSHCGRKRRYDKLTSGSY